MAEEIVLSDRNVPRTALHEELSRLYSQGYMTDITLSTDDGKNFEAHKILLAARSTWFHQIVPRLKADPVVFLKGVKGNYLDKILKFIYGGQVTISKHHLKPILEIAKSLQVKGLQDVTPQEILGRQSVVSAGRFKPDSPLDSPLLTSTSTQKSSSHGRSASSSSSVTTVEKATFTTFKTHGKLRSSALSAAAVASSSSTTRSGTALGSSRSSTQQPQQNGSTNTGDSDNSDKGDSDAESSSVGTRTTRKRGRGRPPGSKKGSSASAAKEKAGGSSSRGPASGDPYEFDDGSGDGADADGEGHGRYKGKGGKKSKRSGNEHEENPDDEDSEENQDDDKGSPKYHVHGKSVITVKCKSHIAELHCNRFVSGLRGQCIKYKDQWVTPQEFEASAGGTGRKYLENIQTDYGPLKALTLSGTLKPVSPRKPAIKPVVAAATETSTAGSSKRKQQEEAEAVEEDDDDDEEDDEEQGEEGENEEGEDDDEEDDDEDDDEIDDDEDEDDDEEPGYMREHGHGGEEEQNRSSKKKKKKKHRDDWKRQITNQLKTELEQDPGPPGIPMNQNHMVAVSMAAPVTATYISQHDLGMHHGIYTDGMDNSSLTMPTFAAPQTIFSTTMDLPPKISPSPHIQIPQLEAGTIYVMSPHPSMSTPATPQHNPFAMSPAPQMQTITHHQPIKPSTAASASGQTSVSGSGGGITSGTLARIGNVLNVRCKSTTAILNANKYESGSKGKCIQLGDEWLTPNEFEERAGSKAKKYLSSIKCMGRPLRVYVNSGELRGSGPPPPPKGSKINKQPKLHQQSPQQHQHQQQQHMINGNGIMTHQQAIAPAPAVNTMQAPPTPSHISSAPAIPQNLIMGNGQPPTLINQTSMASSMMGGQALNLPMMTFNLVQPLEVRQTQQM